MEIWKDIKGFENKYQISNLGNVKSILLLILYLIVNYHIENWGKFIMFLKHLLSILKKVKIGNT